MKKKCILLVLIAATALIAISFKNTAPETAYTAAYFEKLQHFKSSETALWTFIEQSDLTKPGDVDKIRRHIQQERYELKGLDFWYRYLEPIAYKKINGPLPVEWETEAFEKFEKPYKREGAGLTLAALYLDEPALAKDTLLRLIRSSIVATDTYAADSITEALQTYHHFYLCNRLYLLNLAAIYTTGFECPDTAEIIPELHGMLADVGKTYSLFNESFPATPLSAAYLQRYQQMQAFVAAQPSTYSRFDHFTFIKDYVNPLFILNQELIKMYHVISKSMVDYALNKEAVSIFKKSLYNGQNPKGIFRRVKDEAVLAEIDRLGKLLFYDPILSANNQRSCASCHKPTEYFTDTVLTTSRQFNHHDFLSRNTPSLLNAQYNQLVMLDGKHISLQNQTMGVISSETEMSGEGQDALHKVLSCKEYKTAFTRLLKYTPQEPEITLEHIASAITLYYSKFSKAYAPFDEAMNDNMPLAADARQGFNLFMGKAQCGTCHFVPQFNGVKPPFLSSEFEVLGVPGDTAFSALDTDEGRYSINAAPETMHAFRTGSIRNAAFTKPYMHNGVFNTLSQVIDFYNAGGGRGHGLNIPNQTLSGEALGLSAEDKKNLIAFINSLNEHIVFEEAPKKLTPSARRSLNKRIVGGIY